MSLQSGSREDGRPDILVFLDASNGPLNVPKFAHRIGVVSAVAEDGSPIVKDSDEGTLDYRCLRFLDLQQKDPNGLPDRRLSVQHFVDFGADYADVREKDAPYQQDERFTALNGTTRWADGSGRVALPTSFSRLIGSEDGRDAVALAIRGPVMGEPDAVDVEQDLEALNTSGLPEGVAFRNVGTQSGTGGSVTRAAPSVSVGGLTFFGAGPVAAAASVARGGGTLQQIRDAARAAAFGLPAPPFTPEGTKTRPPAPIKNAAGNVVQNNHPLGYVYEQGVDRIGLAGTLFTSGAIEADVLYFRGREGTPINRLAMRHDGHVAMSETRTGRVHFVPTEISGVPEGDGDMIKGWMMHDASKANEGTQVGQETGQWRPVIRVGLKDITGTPPPPFPPFPPKRRREPPPFLPPEEEIVDEGTDTGFDPYDTGYPTGLPGDPFDPVTGTGIPTGSGTGSEFLHFGQRFDLSPGAGGAPGPAITATPGAPGHLGIFPGPSANQLVIGIAGPPVGDSGFVGGIPLDLPGGLGTGGPIGDSGFVGGLPLGIPGGTPGGFGFDPQPQTGGFTDAEAAARNAARAQARAEARQAALNAEQAAINALKAKAVKTGGPRGRRMQARADRAQRARDQREARRQKREDYKRRKKEEAEARRRRRKKKKEEADAAVLIARLERQGAAKAARAAALAPGTFGSVGYAIDVTDPESPKTFGDAALAAEDEKKDECCPEIGNTATSMLSAPGSPGGPANLAGWTAMATYAVNSQQTITNGAFGGRGFLNAPINVIAVHESKPEQLCKEPCPTPVASTIGSLVASRAGSAATVNSLSAVNLYGGVHAATGTRVTTDGAGIVAVTREHSGGGSITDTRPAIFVATPTVNGTARTPTGASAPPAIQVGDDGQFHVGYGGAVRATALAVTDDVSYVAKAGEVHSARGFESKTQDPSTMPAARPGALALRFGTDGKVYKVDDAGTATELASGGATTLDSLTDVDTTGFADGEVLTYNAAGSNWISAPATGTSDPELLAIAGLVSAADTVPYFTGSGTAALSAFTAFGRSLADDANAAAGLTTLGVSAFAQTILDDVDATATRATIGAVIGTNVQAYHARLADVAAVGITADNFLAANGSNLVLKTPAQARTSLALVPGTDVQAYHARLADVAAVGVTNNAVLIGDGTNLVLESGATLKTSLGLTIGTDVQAFPILEAHLPATAVIDSDIGVTVQGYDAQLAQVAAIVPAVGQVLYTSGTDILALAAGTTGKVLTANTGAAPTWETPSAGSGDVSFLWGTGALGAVTISANTEANGEFNYTTLGINTGITLRVTAGLQLIIRSTGAITLTGTAKISGVGRGSYFGAYGGTGGAANAAGGTATTGGAGDDQSLTVPNLGSVAASGVGSGGGSGARTTAGTSGAGGQGGDAHQRSEKVDLLGFTATGAAGGAARTGSDQAGAAGVAGLGGASIEIDATVRDSLGSSQGEQLRGMFTISAAAPGGGGGGGGVANSGTAGSAAGNAGVPGGQTGTAEGLGGNGTAGSNGTGAGQGGGGGAGGLGSAPIMVFAKGGVAGGTITSNGGRGGNGGAGGTGISGGGGGAGGSGAPGGYVIVLYGVSMTATVTAAGGVGGTGGAGGVGSSFSGGAGADGGAGEDGYVISRKVV